MTREVLFPPSSGEFSCHPAEIFPSSGEVLLPKGLRVPVVSCASSVTLLRKIPVHFGRVFVSARLPQDCPSERLFGRIWPITGEVGAVGSTGRDG